MVEAYLVTTLSLEHMIRVLQMLPFPACFPRCSIVLSAVKGIMEMSDNDSVRATRVEDEIFRRGPAPSIAVWSNNRERVVTCSRMPSLIKCGGRLENTAIRFNCISPSTVNSNPHQSWTTWTTSCDQSDDATLLSPKDAHGDVSIRFRAPLTVFYQPGFFSQPNAGSCLLPVVLPSSLV